MAYTQVGKRFTKNEDKRTEVTLVDCGMGKDGREKSSTFVSLYGSNIQFTFSRKVLYLWLEKPLLPSHRLDSRLYEQLYFYIKLRWENLF